MHSLLLITLVQKNNADAGVLRKVDQIVQNLISSLD